LSNLDGSKHFPPSFSLLIPVANVKCVVDRAARICIAMRNRTREREKKQYRRNNGIIKTEA